jgi:hypothetical protein
VPAPAARLAYTYDGGIGIVDAQTLEEIADLPLAGYNRLNAAGDAGSIFVTTATGFQVLDSGAIAEGHGDHFHYYAAAPALLDLTYPAAKPGHVVSHDGLTALFDDGTGSITVLDTDAIGGGERVGVHRIAHPQNRP